MKLLKSKEEKTTVEITRHELIIINNALNEVCNGLDLPDFSLRMGATLPEVTHLLEQIQKILNE